ncbi:hypothetical protein [Haloactinospora alba]|nr:hypothetical protein [Haloactinospora alba]
MTADRDVPVPSRTARTSHAAHAQERTPRQSVLPPGEDPEALHLEVAMVRPYYRALERQRAWHQERDRADRVDRDRLGVAVLHDIARHTRREGVAA